MKFSLEKSLEIIENTPNVLFQLLNNLSDEWTLNNEGVNTWNVKEVVAHLIVLEDTNWMTRTRIILSNKKDEYFVPVDMNAHFEIAQKTSLKELLTQFKELRRKGIDELKGYNLQEADFLKVGLHPVTGEVMLPQIIATWVSHDLAHIAQIARIIAKQNIDLVGSFRPFIKFFN